jgi:hypothetical protein
VNSTVGRRGFSTRRRLFVVTDAVVIKGRGIVLFPGIVPVGDEVFRAVDKILLRGPDGSSLTTAIRSLELVSPNPRNEVHVMLATANKEDVPVGTEVWSVGGD